MKKLNNGIIITILLYLVVLIFMNSSEVKNGAIESINIWKNNIFPTLFPFFIISNILINYGFVNMLSFLFNPITKIFKVNSSAAFIIIMSMLSGFPSNSKYIKEFVEKKTITASEAAKILTFSHFSNPLFILNTIGINFLKNEKIGIIILIVHYMTNFIIGFLFRNLKTQKSNEKIINKQLPFGNILSKSITDGINTLLLILGTIAFFQIIISIINTTIHSNELVKTIISGIIEMTQGIKNSSLLNIPIKYKAIMCIMFISFGGISIHIQVYSIINELKINYKYFFVARIIHALISGLILFFIL